MPITLTSNRIYVTSYKIKGMSTFTAQVLGDTVIVAHSLDYANNLDTLEITIRDDGVIKKIHYHPERYRTVNPYNVNGRRASRPTRDAPAKYKKLFADLNKVWNSVYNNTTEDKEGTIVPPEDKEIEIESPKDLNEFGYVDGEPTDSQLQLQDTIDNAVQIFFNKMRAIYSLASGQTVPEVEHDINKLSQVREKVEDLLSLPDIY